MIMEYYFNQQPFTILPIFRGKALLFLVKLTTKYLLFIIDNFISDDFIIFILIKEELKQNIFQLTKKNQSNQKFFNNQYQMEITDQYRPIQVQRSYTLKNTSQIKDMLSDNTNINGSLDIQFSTKKQVNPITQQSKQLKIPKISSHLNDLQKFSSHKNNRKAENQVQNNKFFKPYSQCTKYIDNLSQHKALIRRGPFNIPLHKKQLLLKQNLTQSSRKNSILKSQSKQLSEQSKNSRLKAISHSFLSSESVSLTRYKSVFRTKKQLIYQFLQRNNTIQAANKDISSKSVNKFDKTLNNHTNNYKNLMNRQRYLKEDQISLKNSVNKLIAVDLIKQKLLINSHLTKNNLQKLHKKFRKKPEIFIQKSQ